MVLLFSLACFLFNFPSFLSFKDCTAQVGYLSDISDHIYEYLFTSSPVNIPSANDNHSQRDGKQRALTFPLACLEAQKISFIFV